MAAPPSRHSKPPLEAFAQIGKQDAPLTRPEAIRAMIETILHILSKDTGEKGGQEGEDPTKENTLFKITAASAIGKRDGQTALAASPNPQWTEYEMQVIGERIARQNVTLDPPRSHPPTGRARAEGEKEMSVMRSSPPLEMAENLLATVE